MICAYSSPASGPSRCGTCSGSPEPSRPSSAHAPVVWGVERRLHLLVGHEAVVLRCHRPKQLGCSCADAPHRRQSWEPPSRSPHAPAPRHARPPVRNPNRMGQVAAEYTLERRHLPGPYECPNRLSNEWFSNIMLTTWSKLSIPASHDQHPLHFATASCRHPARLTSSPGARPR